MTTLEKLRGMTAWTDGNEGCDPECLAAPDARKLLALYKAAMDDICDRGGHAGDCQCKLCVALRAIEEKE